MRHLISGGALAATALLASASVAAATPGARTVTQVYPAASALCAKAQAGTLPPTLAPSVTAVTAACSSLLGAFDPLVGSLQAAQSTFSSTVAAERALVDGACPKPAVDRAKCVAVRHDARTAIESARQTRRDAVVLFGHSIEANRTTFWTTIRALHHAAPAPTS